MPKTIGKRVKRENVRIPITMVEEIDRIVRDYPEFAYNRQKFIESAIADKIERIKMMEAGLKKAKPQSSSE